MAEKDFVKAQVVDITRPGPPLPPQVAVNAGVLYFVFYPNFADLQLAGGSLPRAYQLRDYAAWLNQALRAGMALYTSAVTLGEFVRLAEYAEMEAVWMTAPARVPGDKFSPQVCKKTRYDEGTQSLASIRRRCDNFLHAARKTVALLPRWAAVDDEHLAAMTAWQSSAGDFADATLVANARHAGIPHVLADDVDLLTFDQITVYTANRHALDAARAAGRLLN